MANERMLTQDSWETVLVLFKPSPNVNKGKQWGGGGQGQ